MDRRLALVAMLVVGAATARLGPPGRPRPRTTPSRTDGFYRRHYGYPIVARSFEWMSVDTLEELFLVELKDVYDSEHRLTGALTELADAVDDESIATAFEDHEAQTEGHIDRLETVFEALGEEPEREDCQASQGMIEETETFLKEKEPSQAVANRYAVTAAQKTERYEITAYENMLQWANEAGMAEEVTEALRANLDEEIETLQKLQGLAEEFDYQQLEA